MKRIAGIFLAALLALTVLPHGAELVTSDDVTKGIVTTAYAEDALGSGQVSIGGVVLDGSNTKYYKNDGTKGSASDYDAKFENGVLTLNELELNGQIVSNGDLTIVVHAKGATIDYTTTETGKAAIQVEGNLKVTYNSYWSNLTINTTGADAINATGTVSMGGVVLSAIAINGSGIVAGGKVDIDASARVNVKGTYGIYSKVNATYDGISVHEAACVTADAVETGLYAPNGRVSVSDSGGVLSNGQRYGVYGATVSVGHHMVAYGGVKAIEGTLSLGGKTASAFVIKSGATSAGAVEKDEVESCVNDQYVLILWKHENDPSDHRAYCEINFSSNGGSGTQEKEMVLWGTGCSALPECTITPPEGKVFNGWSLEMGWSGETITSLTPAQTARGYLQLYATWKTDDGGETKYALTVNNGTGSGEYVEGEVVTIAANPAAANHSFYMWDGAEGLEFVDGTSANKSTVKFKMPNHAVTLTAKYLDTSVLQVIIDPNGGEFTDSVVVTLKPSKELTLSTSKIYYTTDGSHPATSETRMEYTGPFTLTESCKVIASIYRVNIGASEPSDPPTDTKYADFVIKKDSGGETGGETTEHKHCVCGGSSCTDSTHADETFQKWESTTSLPASGKYYLANNVTLARSHVVEGDLVLCLNGKTVTASDSITVTNGKTFTLTDCEPNGNKGVISRSSDTTSGEAGVRMVNGAHFVMYGGTIQNSWIGVEVIYESDGTFTMYGGTITGCKSSGVVVQETSNISILGGKITGNYTGMTVYGGKLTIGGDASITGNTGEGNSARNVNFECREITPITVRNDFTGSFGVTVWDSVATGTKIIDGNGYTGTITCDNRGKVIDESGKLRQAPVENTYTVTFVVDSTTPWGTVAPSIVQNVPYGAEIKWNQANRGITVGEQSVAVTPQAEDAEYTYSVEAMRFERNVVTQNTTVTVVFGRTAKTGGETPTPTPEAPRYYYSSGSGSTGAGGLSAVQNDPNGKSATDYSGGIYGLLFRTNAALSAFRGVQVDGVTIDAANYSVEGNEVYLKAAYLQTLANGKHTLTVLSGEGDATAQFTVGGVVSAPKTADAGALAYLGLALSSYVGTALVTRRKKEF